MLGEMLCNTVGAGGGVEGSQRTETLWHMESQRGHYGCTTHGLDRLNPTSHTEQCVSKVGHSAKLNPSFKMTSQNGILDSISSPFVHSVSAEFKKLLPKGV